MKNSRWIILFLLLVSVGCTQTPEVTPTPTLPPTATLADPVIHSTSVPDVKAAARSFLDAWKAEDYAAMYALLTSVSKDAISEEEFATHYRGIAIETTLSSIDYEVLSSLTHPDTAQVSYRVTLHSTLVGDLRGDTVMNLTLEKGQWRVQWDDTLVLPDLAGGNHLRMDISIPARANIYDRNGHALVAQADATAIGIYPDNIDYEYADQLFGELSRLTGLRADTIQNMYANFPPGGGWYLPLGTVPASQVASRFNVLSGLSGLVMRDYKSRYYFDGGTAPHVVGYVSAIQAEELEEYRRLGYRQDERVGRIGLERWGEQYLAGKRGGSLYVVNSQGQPVTRLAETATQPAQAIYTTIDRDFQIAVQRAIAGFRGAIVVLERDTGRVLAMASSPSFDPNAFEPTNLNSYTTLGDIYNDTSMPLYNRATQGQYPLGSVFKIITMAAGLESGVFTPEYNYQCGYFFNDLPGLTLNDWTYDHYLQDGKTQPSGMLNVPESLMRSCNPFFYHVGLTLYNQGLSDQVPEMARGFGLGSRTGIEGVGEEAGQVPDPSNPVDATNLAIGQGDLQVTPLQVAAFIAAVGNDGTIYRPQLIEKISPPDGEPSFTFEPQVNGTLPVSPETLEVIRMAMRGVVGSTQPRGTAYHVFTGLDIPVAGKTGTATSGQGEPHAWFAGYTYAERPNKPDIAIAVIVENIGEGSDYAAPIFRRIVELYFRGSPGKLYWWESNYNVTSTPTLPVTLTPVPEEGEDEGGDGDGDGDGE